MKEKVFKSNLRECCGALTDLSLLMKGGYWLMLVVLPLILCACSKLTGDKTTTTPKQTLEERAKLDALYNPPLPKPKIDLDKEVPLENLVSQGDVLLQAGQYEGSLFNYYQVLKKEPNKHDIRYKVGVILLLSNNLGAAKQELATVLAHQPEMVEAHEALGVVFLREGNYEDAEKEFRYVLSNEPNRHKTRYLISIAYLQGGKTPQAIAELRQILQREPNNFMALVNLGRAYYRQKDYKQSLDWLKRAQALKPEDKKVHYYLGLSLGSMKMYSEALEAYLKAGDEAQAYNNIGVHYFMDKQFVEAAKFFQRALELSPTFYQEAKENLDRAMDRMQSEPRDQGKQSAISNQ
jgi:tetratricopeptide (TPR) repeat protein